MKKLFVQICIGIVVIGIIWYIAECAFEKALLPNSYAYKYNYVKNNSAIKTLLMGHSHFENSINPWLIGDSIFDFAISGRWIYYDVKLAEQLFPTMPNLKTVVFPLGYKMPYESPHYQFNVPGTIDKIYLYSRFMNVYYDRFPRNVIYQSALLCNKIGPKFWKEWRCWINNTDSIGYEAIYKNLKDGDLVSDIDSAVFEGHMAQLCYKEYRQYLIQLARICADNNIRFIVVTCPCANCFVQNTCEQGMQNLYALVDSVRSYYPIEYRCYLNDEDFREDSLYYNSSHLNTYGADKFAIRLKKDFDL